MTSTAVAAHSSVADDYDSSVPSSPDDVSFDDDFLPSTENVDDVTSQLVAAGPVGVAAAAAIASARKRKRPHSFETNPSVRKRQQTKLIRKLKATIDEYSTRVGQQAVVLIVTPGKPHNNYKVFGAHPLEKIIRNCKNVIVQEFENALAEQAPPAIQQNSALHELPPLVVDGIPTPVEKMTQAQLRAFIPLMLRYSTGRGKPGWGRESTKPLWWPKDLPWANVRSDVRTEDEKQRVSWTHALRQIVLNCYKFHGREDLLPVFTNDEEKPKPTFSESVTHYAPAVVQAVNNPDGTMSVIHMDPATAIVTLPDGTQAQLRAVTWPDNTNIAGIEAAGNQSVQALMNSIPHLGDTSNQQTITVNLNGETTGQAVAALAEATIDQDGHLVFSSDGGVQNGFSVASMVTIPVSTYQSLLSNLTEMQTMQVTLPPGTNPNATIVKIEADSVRSITDTDGKPEEA